MRSSMAADGGNVPPGPIRPTIIPRDAEAAMTSKPGHVPSRPAPPVPNRRASAPPSNTNDVDAGSAPSTRVPPIHPAKRPLPPLPHEMPPAGPKDQKVNSAPTVSQSNRNSSFDKSKRGRPVITVLEARPMNEVGFRGVSPTPEISNTKPEVTIVSAKPMSEVGFRSDVIQSGPSPESQPSGVEMRKKGRSAPPPRPASMPAKPPRPPSQPPVKNVLPETTEEIQTENLIDFSPPKENQPPDHLHRDPEGGRKPPPPRPVSRPQSLHFGSPTPTSSPVGQTPLSADSSGYVSQVNTCESQASLTSDGSEEQVQAPIARRRQMGVQVLPVGPGMLKPVSDSEPKLASLRTDEGEDPTPIPSPRSKRKAVVPPSPKPRSQKNIAHEKEPSVRQEGDTERENTHHKEPVRHPGVMVLPPMPKPRSPSPKPENITDDKKEESKHSANLDDMHETSTISTSPKSNAPKVKPKPSVKPKPAVKPKPTIAAKPKPQVASKPSVNTGPPKPSRGIQNKPVNKYLSLVEKSPGNDSFYEDKPLDDSFYETVSPVSKEDTSLVQKDEKTVTNEQAPLLYPDLSSLGDDGTVYPDLSRVAAHTKVEEKEAAGDGNKPIDEDPNKPEILEQDIKPVQRKRPTIIKARKRTTPTKESQEEPQQLANDAEPVSIISDEKPAVQSENTAEGERKPIESSESSDPAESGSAPVRKPTIIRPSRLRATSPESPKESPNSPPSQPKTRSPPPPRPASPTKSPVKQDAQNVDSDSREVTPEDFRRLKSYLVRSDSVSSSEQAENIVNEIRIKGRFDRARSVSPESSDSQHGAARDMSPQADHDSGNQPAPRESPEIKKEKTAQRSSWVPPGAVRVMAMPPPLPRSGPVAVSTPDLRIDPTEEGDDERKQTETWHNPVRVLPSETSRDMSTRSVSMMALHQPAAEGNLDKHDKVSDVKDERIDTQQKQGKPQRPPPARPAPARPPPAKPPPARPSVIPRKVQDNTSTDTKPSESISRPKSGPSRPARSGPLKAPPKPAPPSSQQGESLGPPPRLPKRPGPGHPLYHYVVQGPHGIALFDYTASDTDELSFKAGDVIELEEEIGDGWMVGRNSDQRGMFPLNFIDVVEAPPVSNKKRSVSESTSDGAIPGGVGPRCVARFDYEPAEEGDLRFVEADVIKLTEHVGDDWLKGSINGIEGIFPLAFVEIVEDLPPVNPASPSPVSDPNIVTATFDYQGEKDDLRFKTGDKVNVLGQVSQDWLFGQTSDGSTGIFPVAFVDRVPDALPLHNKSSVDIVQHENGMVMANETNQAKPEEEEPFCVAEYDFTSEDDADLHFVTGDRIRIESHVNADWMKGSLNGKTGMFPMAFVSIVKDVKESSTKDSTPSLGGTEENSAGIENSSPSESESPKTGKAVALYEFAGETDEDLSLKVGDDLILKELVCEGWYRGSVINSDKCGMFPAAFVKVLEPLE